jgi:hypothetical protein
MDEDGYLEIKQPAELFEIELAEDGPLTMREVRIGETDDDVFELGLLVEAEDDG